MTDPGDKVKITLKDGEKIGILVPSKQADFIMIKLNSGYNIGIEKKNIKKIEIIEKYKESKTKPACVKADPKLKTIAILHTGGTIASKVDYKTGGVISKFSPEELVKMFPGIEKVANIQSELIRNMWSDDLRFKHFGIIAEAIKKYEKKGIDGIIIGMGTDNLAVAAAALSFIIEETPIPIIMVGAQRSSDRGSSDAAMNLICAAEYITKTRFKGVAICMHGGSQDKVCDILPGTKTKKLHTSRRDAFRAVNDTPIASVDYQTRKIKEYKKFEKGEKLIIKDKMEEKVGILKVCVNMQPEQVSIFNGYKGLVIEGTGLGHAPIDVIDDETKIHEKIKKELEELIKNGTVIVMTSNCIFGRVNMNVYSKGRDLQQIGIIGGEDMLTDTAYVKLSWLLANDPKNAKELINKNLRGEITPRTEFDD